MKECPWCGSIAHIEITNAKEQPENGERAFCVKVRCSNNHCGATCPNGEFSTLKISLNTAEKKAIEKWDKRAPIRRGFGG